MSKSFQKGKSRQARINGQWIFGDFSEGLYLLDTPRSITEQLGSLALVGGRNTFCEKGALIPQYGYVEKAKIDSEYIVAVSKDVESGYLFLLANTGNVFLYTPSEGLKKYKTTLGEVSEEALMTCRQDEMIISDSGKNILFGSYYGNESTLVPISTTVPISTYGYYSDIKVPIEDSEYYWLGKKVDISGIGEATVRSISREGVGRKPTDFTFDALRNDVAWRIEGSINVQKGGTTVNLGDKSKIVVETTTQAEQTVTRTERDYEYYGYNYTQDKSYAISPFVIESRPKDNMKILIKPNTAIGSEDIYMVASPSGTPVSQTWQYKNDKGAWVNDTQGNQKVYAVDGESVTKLYPKISDRAKVGLGSKLTRNTSYDRFTERVVEEIKGVETTTGKISFIIPDINGDNRTSTFTIDKLQTGSYTYVIEYYPSTQNINIQVKSGNSVLLSRSTVDGKGGLVETQTSPNSKVGGDNSGILLYVNGEQQNFEEYIALTIRLAHQNTADVSLSDTATISERCYKEFDMNYIPDVEGKESRTIVPKLIAWCCNRLFVEHMNGEIYYSAVGNLDVFNESLGAGFFKGFYGDNSELLSIEEFLGKALLTKKNGMYTLVIGQGATSYSTAAGTSVDTSGINIEKIAEIGQEYATDHVIVKEAIYAYDSNSASIVQAAAQNVFGSIVAGTPLISADYLNAQNFGIIDRKRCLTYNSEAQVFILYFGEDLTDGIVLTAQGSLFPRKLDRYVRYLIGFNQGVLGIMADGTIFQDFKRNTVIPTIRPVAEFEAIGLKDNRLLCGSILEVTELNGVEYDIGVTNTSTSFQHIQPYTNYGIDGLNIPPLIYSDKRIAYPSFEEQTKWAAKKSNLTRVYAPMSGREGVSITMQFPPDVAFCLVALRIPDFSQGE